MPPLSFALFLEGIALTVYFGGRKRGEGGGLPITARIFSLKIPLFWLFRMLKNDHYSFDLWH
jgi:hypothetical protein